MMNELLHNGYTQIIQSIFQIGYTLIYGYAHILYMGNITVTNKEMIAAIRKVIKNECTTLSVRKEQGWCKIEGSLEYGKFSDEERSTLVKFGFQDPNGSNVLLINSDEELDYWYKIIAIEYRKQFKLTTEQVIKIKPINLSQLDKNEFFNDISIDQLFEILKAFRKDAQTIYIIRLHYEGQMEYCESCIRRLKGSEYKDQDVTEDIERWNTRRFKAAALFKLVAGFYDLAWIENDPKSV